MWEFLPLSLFAALSSPLVEFVGHVIILILRLLFGLQLYEYHGNDTSFIILGKLAGHSTASYGDYPMGVVWGWKYVGYIKQMTIGGYGLKIYIITTPTFNKELISLFNEDNTHVLKTINICGNPKQKSYDRRSIEFNLTERPNQIDAINQIIWLFKR
jgi:hypothetical protein